MPNRLRDASSPYLLQHADNPVDWYEWGEGALELARSEDKPIFLSIGYAACHWCHVMAHESFEDDATAQVMNEHFINIKVDREERPDIDSIYMDAVVAMTGQGGWPMSVFLAPDGKPFFGGTYFPPNRRQNLPGFRDLLLEIARLWDSDRNRLLGSGEEITGHLRRDQLASLSAAELDRSFLDRAAAGMHASYDWSHGGWGAAPKFPQATSIDFLLDRFMGEGDKLARDMATHALLSMARGGIYDQLGGGFARYAVDRDWQIPHFEKMLYDNALLLASYLKGWQVTSEPTFRRVADETFTFLMREMRHESGGFFSSLDADSEGEEGKYYAWDSESIQAALSDHEHLELVLDALGILDSPNFEGAYVLRQAKTEAELSREYSLSPEQVTAALADAKQTLYDLRQNRVRPSLDDKILTSWNGMLLQSLALGAQATGESRWLQAAQTLAEFLITELLVEGQLHRSWRAGQPRFQAYLEDHAALGLGLLELYQTDFNERWYHASLARANEIVDRFRDEAGGFFDTARDHEQLIARPQSTQDTPIPSGNSMTVNLLLRLYNLSGDEDLLTPAEAALRRMVSPAQNHPTAFAGWLQALSYSLSPQPQLALVGDPRSPDFRSLAELVQRRHTPQLILAGGDPDSETPPQLLLNRSLVDEQPTAYLCQSFACQLPTNDVAELARQLEALTS